MIPGLDISHWQGTIDWPAVARSGQRFAFLKATEGAAYVDPTFRANRDGALAAGMAVGAYHFAQPSEGSAVAQAERHFRTAGPLDEGRLPCVLDLEHGVGDLTAWTLAYLDRIEELTGRVPIVYTYASFWRLHVRPLAEFGRYPLWLAAYGPAPSALPPWPGWLIWQYTSGGSVPGIAGRVDLNRFAGSQADLDALAGRIPPPPAGPQEDEMQRTCHHPTLPRQPDGRVPTYRWLDGVDPTRVRVLGYNGAPLYPAGQYGGLTVTAGSAFGVPFIDLAGLAAPVSGIGPTSDGSVVLDCEDGGSIDVAAPA